VVQQFTDNPKKKPVATVGFVEELYLRKRVEHQISKVSPPPITRDHWPAYEYLRDLAWRLRRQTGRSVWELACAALFLIGIGIFAMSLRETGYTYSAPENKFRVLEQINNYDFVLQRVENGLALPPSEFRFCHDYQPLFSPGMTLSWFSYADRGSCQSIKAADKGYVLERHNHWPTLAPNCHEDLVNDRVVCVGKPQF
jgi:hypothetical protein